MIKLLIDGEIHDFADEKKAVEYMNSTAFQPSASAEQYMIDYANRAAIFNGSIVRKDSFEGFIESLIFLGYLSRV